MNNCFKNIEENNREFIEILKKMIIENRMSLDQEKIKEDDYKVNFGPTYEYLNLEKKINEFNKDNAFFQIKLHIRPTGHRNKMDYYIYIKQEEKNAEEYTFHFHLNKKQLDFKVITHQFDSIGNKASGKFTYTPNATIYEIPKEKKTIRLEGKSAEHNIEELNDIFLLTKDISFLEQLKFSLKIIGTDSDKKSFIENYKEKYKEPTEKNIIKKIINKIMR